MGAIGGIALAAGAYAHNGATGVVMERMMGMSAMRDTMRELTPMMRGDAAYDAALVRAAADRIAGHAGEAMIGLFPEGSLEPASYAKPAIWTDWREFSRLADALRGQAEGLARAAPNGLEPAVRMAAAGGAMDHSMMQMETPAPARLSVAELMGYAAPSPPAGGMAVSDAGLEDLASMAADDLFTRIAQTCSACHARFRTGS